MSPSRWLMRMTGRLPGSRSPVGHPPRRTPHARLQVETLEPRLVLSGATPVWNDTSQLTLSFVPDGTDVAGQSSDLYASFNQIGQPQEWKEAILRAFQTWVIHTRVNVGVVADQGLPLGTPGPRTQDPRFGDLRIGARPLSGDVMAIGVSQNAIVGGTWAGDVIFNSAASYASLDDLFAVALHEAGHILGMSHSDDPLSPMYGHGLPPNTDLTEQDLLDIQDLQGQRLPDTYEGDSGNDTRQTAVELSLPQQTAGQLQPPILIYADLTTSTDVDYFALPQNHRGAAPVTVRLQSKEISLLAPRVRVVTRNGREIASSASMQPGGATVLVRIDDLDQGERYYIEVTSARSDEFSVGGYSLIVTYDGLPQVEARRIDDVAVGRARELDAAQVQSMLTQQTHLLNSDLHQDDQLGQARWLGRRNEFVNSARFETVASISDSSDIDYYRFDTHGMNDGDPLILNLTVHSLSPGELIPRATVFDQRRERVSAEVLVNGQGEFVIQAQLLPEQVYFVRVEAADAQTPFITGNYGVTLALVDEWVRMNTYLSAAVSSDHPLAVHSLYVAQSQLFHTVVKVQQVPQSKNQLLVAQFVNEEGGVLAQLGTSPGDTRSFHGMLLTPGQYSVRLFAAGLNDDRLAEMVFQLRGTTFSDPLGVDPIDPTEDPVFLCPGEEDLYCYPGGVVSEDPFLWDDFIDTLPELPNLELSELIDALLGDWWSWYWGQQGQNGPALTLEDEYVLDSGQALLVDATEGVLANDLDPEGGPLVAVLVDDASHGRLTLNPDGSFTYAPDAGFVGTDQFRYLAYDFVTESTPAVVWLEVAGPAGTVGDLNGDLLVDAADLQLLSAALQAGLQADMYDLTQDGEVNHQDLLYLVEDLLGTSIGDANLDGRFDSSDLVSVFQAGVYEAGQPGSADWSTGDWTCDGQFDTSDLVFAFSQGDYETAVPASVSAADLPNTVYPGVALDVDDPRWDSQRMGRRKVFVA